MHRTHAKLALLAGLWFSLLSLSMAASVFAAPAQGGGNEALLYRLALSLDEPHEARAPESGKALIADMGSMQISLFEDGILMRSFPIVAKGRPGTPWETPTGRYAIQTKEEKHFSSIGQVWMPYSMQFYGNFFIHGWPTYTDGTEVPVGYSGGCIRLSTADAREIYLFADRGTRVHIVGGAAEAAFATSSHYYLRGEAAFPAEMTSAALLVGDVETGEILWERNGSGAIHPGETVSLMTALTALETVNQYKYVRMTELIHGKTVLRARATGASDELPVGTLIYTLLFGANDTAAKAFAREHGTKHFVRAMNEKAAAIGMTDTVFSGPETTNGATTTAVDLFRLARHIKENKRYLLDVTRTRERVLLNGSGNERFRWENKNPWILSGNPYFSGGVARPRSDGSGSALLYFTLPLSEFGSRELVFAVIDADDIVREVDLATRFVEEHFVHGALREGTPFILEKGESKDSVIEKAQELLEIERYIEDRIIFEREV